MTETRSAAALAPMTAPAESDPGWGPAEWFMIGVVLAPFVVGFFAVVFGVGSGFHALADNAINELRVRDIGHYSVLIGPFSRNSWSHPGPAMYYALALPYRLLGRDSSAMLAGALMINGATSVGAVVVARRVGGRAAMAVFAFSISIVVANLGAELVRNPWNPYLTVLPFALMFAAAWGLAIGRTWYLPLVAFVATFEVQTHIGYLPIAGAIALWSLVAWALARRRDRLGADPARGRNAPILGPLLATVVVLGVMWAPPVIDQISGAGNLDNARAFFTRDTPTRGLDAGYRVVAEAYTVTPDWVLGADAPGQFSGEPLSVLHPQWPFLAAIFLGALTLTWRRQSRAVRQLAIGLSVAAVISVIALARTPGPIYDYRLRWLWLLGALTLATTVWMAARAWIHARRAITVLVACVGAVLLVTGAASVVAATSTGVPDATYVRRMDTISREVLARVRPAPGTVIVRPASFPGYFYVSGLVLRLEDSGVRVRVDDNPVDRLSFGAHRVYRGGPLRSVLSIAVDESVDRLRAQPDQREIAYWGAESRARRAADASLLARLYVRAQSGDRSPSLQRRINQVITRRAAVAVFESRPPS